MTKSRPAAYRQLAHGIRARLRAGEWADGSALPTELELVRREAVSRQTVRRAMQELVAEGVIYRVPGRGTFAAADPNAPYLRQFGSVDDLMALSQDTELEILEPLRTHDDPGPAARLGLGSAAVSSVRFLRRHGADVICQTRVYLPPAVGALLADIQELAVAGSKTPNTVLGLLDRRLEVPIAHTEQTITAVSAGRELGRVLGGSPREPLLLVERLYQDISGVAVELAISHFVPRHYAYRVTLRRQPFRAAVE
ncbi:GntR family transcriptional regulator [Nakamurella lactea]|uniref:GntR family transcriptional regulator n=1 Tax=Nakamurella lactea TaxID=459515 RepID=UPI000409B65C|nr:GntR family transcriptional regulator [Nakamurella lactea]